jgi:very-short-patch-repair endonuclease
MTPDELCLWNALRRKAMGCRFRSQHPYGNFIFDYFFPRARLAVELDGAHHDAVKDGVRDAACDSAGIMTLRFSNDRVRRDLDGVLREIRVQVERRARSGRERLARVGPSERFGEDAIEVSDERKDFL